MSRWVSIPWKRHAYTGKHAFNDILPESPACYAIYLDGQLVYVGQTGNLRKRMHSYKFITDTMDYIDPWGGYCTHVDIKYKPGRKIGDWLMREHRLIRRLQPLNNVKDTPRFRSRAKARADFDRQEKGGA